jgi:hypothetical protein
MSLENSVAPAVVVPASDGRRRLLGFCGDLSGRPRYEVIWKLNWDSRKVVRIMVLFPANARPATN